MNETEKQIILEWSDKHSKNNSYNKNSEEYELLVKNTSFLPENSAISLRIKCVKNGWNEIPKCKCGKPLKIYYDNTKFNKTCGSKECVNRMYNGFDIKKSIESMKERYGVTNHMKLKEFQEKVGNTIRSKTEQRFKDILIRDGYENKLEYVRKSGAVGKSFYHILRCKECECEFEISSSTYSLRHKKGHIICTNCNNLNKNVSCGEKEVLDYVKSCYKGTIQENIKSVIYPYELDVYIPELKFAIEFNGDYVHANPSIKKFRDNPDTIIKIKGYLNRSMSYKTCKEIWERDNHKKDVCKENGIDLLIIWERDWNKKRDYCKDLISNKIKELLEKSVTNNIPTRIDNTNVYVKMYNPEFYHVENVGCDYIQKELLSYKNSGNRLIQLWSDQYYNKKKLYDNIIDRAIGKDNSIVIGARKCTLINLSDYNNDLVKKFIDDNHIQGHVGYTIGYGLIYNNELVFVTTYKIKSKKSQIWEISRVCTKFGYVVIGGLSKLWKKFLNDIDPIECITYCDASLFNGDAYRNLKGMKEIPITIPNYFYYKDKERTSRQSYQKHKLIKKYPDLAHMTETKIMTEVLGYKKIENAGNYKFVYKKN